MTTCDAVVQTRRCPRCETVKPLNDFYHRKGYCKRCVLEYQAARRRCGDEQYIKGKYQRVAHTTLGPEAKERNTERSVEISFGKEAAEALHKMAFAPETLKPGELKLACLVAAAYLKQN